MHTLHHVGDFVGKRHVVQHIDRDGGGMLRPMTMPQAVDHREQTRLALFSDDHGISVGDLALHGFEDVLDIELHSQTSASTTVPRSSVWMLYCLVSRRTPR